MITEFESLVDALRHLKQKGYTIDLQITGDHLKCTTSGTRLDPEDCTVDHVYRFERKSNPADSSVLYAISADSKDIKGVLVSAYGAYSEPMKEKMINLLKMDHH
ncbi:MAG: phosphoribosylpyrophosphate synthetase [Saprospirales bacterium]|nr:MAG: phosphoribosylpyrophosphate synthetase [Saprospirales bacterium]